MTKKLLIAWIVVLVVWIGGGYLVHGTLLHDDYAKLSNIMRTETDMQTHMALMLLARVIGAGAFVWIYARGVEAKPWLGQGIRYGAAIALLLIVPTYMIYYVVQQMPGDLVCKQIAYDGILMLVLGAVVAGLIRK